MKSQILSVTLLALMVTGISKPAIAQLGVGTLVPDPSAQLDVTSTEKGMLAPRVTTDQRTAIAAPADGLLVYDTDSKDFWYYKSGTGWAKVDNAPLTLPYSATENNEGTLFSVTNQGNGTAGNFKIDLATATSAAVKGEVNSAFANFGTAGVYGLSSGTAGYGGIFHSSNPSGSGPALFAYASGSGNAITASASNTGNDANGIEVTASGTGSSVYGWTPNFGKGRAANFINNNATNATATVDIQNKGTGNALQVDHRGSAGNIAAFQNNGGNVARIDKTGTGFFNGGTVSSGADLAEAFDVIEEISAYEPGDVLTISTEKDRTVEKSSEKYSSLVLGVYATKPGVLLTDQHIGTEIIDRVPMGVVGVIPTKVCMEGGAIRRGDLLVTSSIRGVAMKADPEKLKPGQIIGKALQNFDGEQVAKINVFVNVK